MPNAIPVITLAGTPYERGCILGTKMKQSIREFADTVTAVHRENNAWLKASRDPLIAFCKRNLGFLEKHSPDLLEEMRGIADGAMLTFDDILYLNTFLELEDLRAPGLGGSILPDALWGCTTFNVTSEATADGRAYIGQTYDMEKYYEKYLCVLRIREDNGPDQLILTFAGILGLCGINAAGIGAVINKVVATDARPGVIYPFIMRKLLASPRIGDALGAVIYAPRASGLNYQLAGSDVAFCAETSAAWYELLEINGAIAHTNHYLGRTMRRFETANWLSHGGTMVRLQVATNFLKKHRGAITPEMLKELTRNHTNHPRCICAHGFPGESENTAFHTSFGVVMDPEAGWFEACPGNPCENEYQRYTL